jgi:hypothetical protein
VRIMYIRLKNVEVFNTVRRNASLGKERHTHRKNGLDCVTQSVFRLFGPVKNAIRGRNFRDKKVMNQGL